MVTKQHMTILPTQKLQKKETIHLWFPNMFEFKGGIQTYLIDFLAVLYKKTSHISLSVFDKLDKPNSQKDSPKEVNFYFSGHIPELVRTIYFSLQLFIFAIFKKPDLIICGHVNFSPVANYVSRLRNIPYWILVYGVDAWDVSNPIQRKALREANKIISIGTFTRDRIIKEQNIDIEKFSLLPVTFDSERFKPGPKPEYLLHRYGLNSDQPVILTVARLAKSDGYKGYDKIIAALPSLVKVFPNIHYVIAGKGDDQARIEKLVKDLNVHQYVTLAGFIPDSELADHYNLCDAFAMPSKGEGFGIVYLEALSCGKPVLGGNQDGAIDALCFGKLGVLVDPDDIDEISDALLEIFQGTSSNTILYDSQELRQQVISIFGFDQFSKKLNELVFPAEMSDQN
jgi:phosphatidyl-myo-inositol dimannoside synthase